jgi:hypothetical protein
MKLYRAMCDTELKDMTQFNSLSWNSKFKWFGTKEFVVNRVQDTKFNNSKFVGGRYQHLVEFEFDDNSMLYFSKCGNREFMLNIRKNPLVKLLNWRLI